MEKCYNLVMKEKMIKQEEIFKGKVFTVYKDVVELADGKMANREHIKHSGGVCVFAQVGDKVLMVRQFRYSINKEVLEFPAGKLEYGEDPLQAAQRELREETGYLAAKMTSLGYFVPTCGYSNEIIYFFQASELNYVGQDLDPGEFLAVEKVKLSELKDLIDSNEIIDGKTLVLALKMGL